MVYLFSNLILLCLYLQRQLQEFGSIKDPKYFRNIALEGRTQEASGKPRKRSKSRANAAILVSQGLCFLLQSLNLTFIPSDTPSVSCLSTEEEVRGYCSGAPPSSWHLCRASTGTRVDFLRGGWWNTDGRAVTEVLVKWKNMPIKEASWEEYWGGDW